MPSVDRRQQTSQIGQTVGEGHEDARESGRNVQMVDFEAGVNSTVQSHTDRQDRHGQPLVATGEGSGDQGDCWTILPDTVDDLTDNRVREIRLRQHPIGYVAYGHREQPHCQVRQSREEAVL